MEGTGLNEAEEAAIVAAFAAAAWFWGADIAKGSVD
jgi:hypothetical protein